MYFFFLHLDPASIEEEEDCLEDQNGMLIVNNNSHALFGMNDDPRHFNANIKDDIFLSTSHAGVSSSIIGNIQFHNTFNQSSQVLFSNPHSLSRAAQSADTYFLSSSIFAQIQARPKALTNPFAPASIRIPMVPGRRRWAHTFPIGPNKLPWHFHHLRQTEGTTKQEMSADITNCAHLVLPGTSKKIINGLVSKRTRHHAKVHSDLSTKHKRYIDKYANFVVKFTFLFF